MTKGTVIRTVLLVLALVNQVLAAFGLSPLPLENETVTTLISLGFTVVTALVAWWKNNSFTQKAQAADAYLAALRKE
ncbi:MAG: phage holin [Ruminococcaceae bacterium]|nr:phage holin [Oscillospiraceae bacterium]MBQ7302814.1 phage holin [Clostridia bacterium]